VLDGADHEIPALVVETLPATTLAIGSGQVGIASTTKLSKKTSGPKSEFATNLKIALLPIHEVGRYTVVSTNVPGTVVPAPGLLKLEPIKFTKVSHVVAVVVLPKSKSWSSG